MTSYDGQDGIRMVFPNAQFVVHESAGSRLRRIQEGCDATQWPDPSDHWVISRTSPMPFAAVYGDPDTSLSTTLWVDAPPNTGCAPLPAGPPA